MTTRPAPRPGQQDRLLHMIGNSHIDPVWLWQWPEGYQEVRATFRSALDRMNEYPEFIFTSDSAAYYEWVEEIDAGMFAEIQRRVAEGRWEIVGGWWVEPDCNIPSGESFVRHALYSQRYFEAKFGRIASVGFNVDPFGHNGMLPQLLSKAGMDAYVFMRPGPHEMDLPGPLFWWESADGSRVLTMRLPHEYCSPREDLGNHLDKSIAQLPDRWSEMMVFYGVGNHGGGPTKENLESIRRLSGVGAMPRLVHSTPSRFFERVRESGAELPVVREDLQHHAVGCYSAHSGIKRWNRRAENALAVAEAWAAIAARATGEAYPRDDFERAWRNVLFNQFHDILAGTAIEPAYDEARDQLGESTSIAARAANRAMQSISRRIAIPPSPGMTPIVVFNPHAWPLRTTVELEFGGLKPTDGLVDEQGAVVPFQATQSYATVSAWRSRMAVAVDVPPLGYRTYRVVPDTARTTATTLRATDTLLENEHLRAEFDATTGRMTHLVLREDGRDVADVANAERAHAHVVDDTSDTWGHRRLAYRDEIGAFEMSRVYLVESGPVRAILRVESRFGRSTLVEDHVLSVGDRALEVRVILDWHEESKILKLRYATRLDGETATYDIPYGTIDRPANGEEEPGQRWIDLSADLPDGGGRFGLAVLNDGKYSFDVVNGEIGVTAVRSPIYAHHEPRIPTAGVRYQYMDQGQQRFTLALVPHRGGWSEAGLTRRALELNQRPFVLLESYHDGPLPQVTSFGGVEPDNVVIGSLKVAEDGDDVVVRAVETAGRSAAATIRVPGSRGDIAFDIGPYQIRTFRVPSGAGEAVEVDLLERPLAGGELAAPESGAEADDAASRSRVARNGDERRGDERLAGTPSHAGG
ncbi:MAG TPA: glycoside hydrolase family 38 C-terminal domain-containing protein [Candidatus Limnocylindrales bacterium]|nr:glycoside hydrolase family 38 C-terminal domain-containing protein [Candidatus Limnocylindrales bacterium]